VCVCGRKGRRVLINCVGEVAKVSQLDFKTFKLLLATKVVIAMVREY
jgi:hypothetical protein